MLLCLRKVPTVALSWHSALAAAAFLFAASVNPLGRPPFRPRARSFEDCLSTFNSQFKFHIIKNFCFCIQTKKEGPEPLLKKLFYRFQNKRGQPITFRTVALTFHILNHYKNFIMIVKTIY